MHGLCMPTKTISLRIEAYERLRRARRSPTESFSDVVMRAQWPHVPSTAAELLTLVRERGPTYSPEGLDSLEEVKRTDAAPADKWVSE
jgi:hypothetical protein